MLTEEPFPGAADKPIGLGDSGPVHLTKEQCKRPHAYWSIGCQWQSGERGTSSNAGFTGKSGCYNAWEMIDGQQSAEFTWPS